jgi:hypothetical protein
LNQGLVDWVYDFYEVDNHLSYPKISEGKYWFLIVPGEENPLARTQKVGPLGKETMEFLRKHGESAWWTIKEQVFCNDEHQCSKILQLMELFGYLEREDKNGDYFYRIRTREVVRHE